jgi:hypothetical protein
MSRETKVFFVGIISVSFIIMIIWLLGPLQTTSTYLSHSVADEFSEDENV